MEIMTEQGKKWRLAAIITASVLLAAIIILSVFLGLFARDNKTSLNARENSQQGSYFVMMDNLLETEFALKKLGASSSAPMQEKFLNDAARHAEAAAASFNVLTAENPTTGNVTRTLNQITEYSDVMSRSIADGNILSAAEKTDIASMLENIGKINVALGSLNQSIAEGFTFTGKDSGVWVKLLADLETTAADFPIYAFDGNSCLLIGDREPKGLTGDPVSAEAAAEIVKTLFSDASDINLVSQNDRKLAVYLFEFKRGGNVSNAEITKIGGKLLNFTQNREVTDPQYEEAQATAAATEYIKGLGFADMDVYAVSNSNSIYYIDFVAQQNGILLIADKLRVKIAADNGEVLGFSANCYYNFHYLRPGDAPIVTEQLAREKVSADLQIAENGVNLVYYPVGNAEKLAYEIRGSFDGDEYYVYVDATDGAELDILRVIDSDGEKLLR